MNDIETKRNNSKKNVYDTFVDGKFCDSCRAKTTDKTFRFNLAFFTDGVNLFNKIHRSVNAQLLLVLDLPDHVMKQKEFSFTPFFYESRAKLPGY